MKLDLDLIPSSSFYDNVRSAVSKEEWDIIRRKVYKKANYRCEICNGVGPEHPVEAHERWKFTKTKQILIGMIALCPLCHQSKHYGLSIIRGIEQQVLEHFMKINNMTKEDSIAHIKECFRVWEERSKKKWKVDISYLEEFKSS